MEIEDGVIWVYGVGEDSVQAFTDFGTENLIEPSPMTRAGIWGCAMSMAPRQLPSLPPPTGQIQWPERTQHWIKLGGNVTIVAALFG